SPPAPLPVLLSFPTRRSSDLAFLLAIGLFVALPALLLRWISPYIGSDILLNLIEGAIKISFFLAYILAISWMEEIRRVFQYHGRSEEHTSELQSRENLVCRPL